MALYNKTMQALRFEDLAEQVYRSLRSMILSGELVPGQKLVQEALSERLGVSRTPLLAAFSKLEKELLVELVPRRGAFVKRLSPEELLQLYDVRLRLEPLGAAQAAAVAGEAELAEIDAVLASHRDAVAAGEQAEIRLADYRFHMAVIKASGNGVLERILGSFSIVSKSNQRGILKPAEKSLAEHEALRDAIRAKDAERAEAVMYGHLAEARAAAAAIASQAQSARGAARP